MGSFIQRGAVAAYQNADLIQTHFKLADTIESCLKKLEKRELHLAIPSERPILLLREKKIVKPSHLPPTTEKTPKTPKTPKRAAFFSSVLA